MMRGKKVAFFVPNRDLPTNPSLLSLIEELTSRDVLVDLFMPKSDDYSFIMRNVSIRPFPNTFRITYGCLKDTLRGWKWFVKNFTWDGHALPSCATYDLVFGVDRVGVIAAHKYSMRKGVPFIYLSYEISFRDELMSYLALAEKFQEVEACKQAAFVVIQDRWRAELLAKENQMVGHKFAYLPVSPRGPSNRIKGDYLRSKYNIPDDKTIVLHSGSFETWTYAKELIDSIPHLPNDVILVIHTRFKQINNEHINRIIENKYSNVILSLDPLDSIDYEKMVSSADIGLLLYKPTPPSEFTQKNIEDMGLTSGKFSYYMKFGLPVISIKQNIYSELLKEYTFGENVDSILEIPIAIGRIRSNYNKYQNAAYMMFDQKLDFDIFFPEIYNKLSKLLMCGHGV